MKTRVISALGALAMGALAVGCSAETGAPQGGEGSSVGETRSALIMADMPAARTEAASCVITESGIDKMLVFGGKNASGTRQNSTYLYNPAADSWTTKSSAIDAFTNMPAISNAQMVAIPGTDKCLLVGGETSGAALTTAYIYDLSDDDWNTTGSLSNSRVYFKLSQCGTGSGTGATTPAKIIAVGGQDNISTPAAWRDIEVYNANAGTWSSLATFATQRSKVALAAKDTNFDKFIVGGGDSGGGALNSVELLSVSSACASPTRVSGSATIGTRYGAVAFPEGTADTFNVVAGNSGAGVLSTTDKVLVSNWGTGTLTVTTGSNALTTAREFPLVVKYSATKWAVIGGANGSGTALNPVQVWDTGSKSYRGELSLIDERKNAVGEYLPSEERAFIAGGADDSGNAILKAETL